MGLSSKQVSVDGLDWEQSLLHAGALELPKPPQVVRPQQQPEQQQQQQQTPLSCPRCDSTNTKFCYYNNYNRSQPRHFCKACRRHWTKGGTLRNVPVGGGRKNKRVKASSSKNNNYIGSKPQQQEEQLLQHHLSLPFGDQKNLSEILYQALLPPPPSSLPPIPNFPFTSLGSFDNNPSISSPFNGSFQSSNFYDNTGMIETAEDPITTATTTTCAAMSTEMPWQAPNSIGFMDSSTYCGWNDLTGFVTTDVREAWDDYSIQKQQGK